jgi:hypothetical protein
MASSSSSSPTSLLPSEPEPWRASTSPPLPLGALLDIADDLLFDIFSIYLHIRDVCALDSALCNRTRRTEFLRLVSTKVLLFNREEIIVLSPLHQFKLKPLVPGALSWIKNRGIHLATLHLAIPTGVMAAADQRIIRDTLASLAYNGQLDKLETIKVLNCSYIKDADLAVVLSKCHRTLKCMNIRGSGVAEISALHVKRCPNLEAFVANGNVSAEDMAEIFQACPKLRVLELNSFGARLTDELVESIVAHCFVLEHLSLRHSVTVSDAAIRNVAESCPLLQVIDLSGTAVTDATVLEFCMRCPQLKRVLLSYCGNLTDAAVIAVADRLPGLTRIDLNGNAAITSGAVEHLATKCRELKIINSSDCPNVSDVTLMKIAEHGSKLNKLYITDCPNITGVGFGVLACKCRALKFVLFDQRIEATVAPLRRMFPLVNWKSEW